MHVDMLYILSLLQHPLCVCESLLNLVIFQYLSELSGFILQTRYDVFIGRGHARLFHILYCVHQPLCVIGQLSHIYIPFVKTLMTRLAIRKGPHVATPTRVTPSPGHALYAHTLARHLITLLSGNASWVTVACWNTNMHN